MGPGSSADSPLQRICLINFFNCPGHEEETFFTETKVVIRQSFYFCIYYYNFIIRTGAAVLSGGEGTA